MGPPQSRLRNLRRADSDAGSTDRGRGRPLHSRGLRLRGGPFRPDRHTPRVDLVRQRTKSTPPDCPRHGEARNGVFGGLTPAFVWAASLRTPPESREDPTRPATIARPTLSYRECTTDGRGRPM